ncbi:DNA alkylation repair protein [Streptomyces sp. NPDC005931]|uniref:DNA alkylation repair protein n=1 Tax=Streptomyces sp. NPDC005931 TaxID=3364737 RepID=UPI00368F2BB3
MPFADELIGRGTAEALADAVSAVRSGAAPAALRAAADGLGGLALRARSDLLRDALLTDVPGDYASLAATVRAALHGDLPFEGWMIWPVGGAVATRAVAQARAGETTEPVDDALRLLAELTGRFTSEFALRVLLAHDPDRALAAARAWTASDDPAVRRLASEGTRPYLPWAARVPALLAEPRSTLPILDALYRDENEDVRRSVANHLNDLSRQHPGLVVETATAWLARSDPHTARLVRHGLRTLVKQGRPDALALLGFAPVEVDVTGPTVVSAGVPFGGEVVFTATVVNTGPAPARIAVDYVIHHHAASGKPRPKVFKLTTRTLGAGEALALRREHSFRAITTRRYHPGPHAVELQVNGVRSARAAFDLLPPE